MSENYVPSILIVVSSVAISPFKLHVDLRYSFHLRHHNTVES